MDYNQYLLECENNFDNLLNNLNKMAFNEQNKVGTKLYNNLHKLLIPNPLKVASENGHLRKEQMISDFKKHIRTNVVNDLITTNYCAKYTETYKKQMDLIITYTTLRNDRLNEYYQKLLSSSDISLAILLEFIENIEKEKKLLHTERMAIQNMVSELKIKLKTITVDLHIDSHTDILFKILDLV